METGSIYYAVLGGFFVLVGLLMIVFPRLLNEVYENYRQALPEFITWHWPRGKLLTMLTIAFGALSFLGGLIVLLVNFVEP